MSPPSQHDIIRYREVRRADALNDQKTAGQILTALGVSVTQEDLQQFVLSQLKRVIFGNNPGNWYSDFESAGIPSLAQLVAFSPETVIKVHFTYTTSSPLVLQALTVGGVLDRASILITTPFNDPGAKIQLGTSGSPGLVFGLGETDVTQAGQYDSPELSEFTVPDLFNLLITPGASTQGAGLLLYKLRS